MTIIKQAQLAEFQAMRNSVHVGKHIEYSLSHIVLYHHSGIPSLLFSPFLQTQVDLMKQRHKYQSNIYNTIKCIHAGKYNGHMFFSV